MTTTSFRCRFLMLCVIISSNAFAGEIVWTQTTGLYPVESAPVLGDFKGTPAIIAVNRGGGVMVWDADGTALGPEAEGQAAQLPKGVWSSSPTVIPAEQGGGLLACNVDGLVVALDAAFQPRWQYQLPGKTSFSCAAPTLVKPASNAAPLFCVGDQTGALTALNAEGQAVWQTKLGEGECDANIAVVERDGIPRLLASEGPRLHCLDGDGQVIWTRELKGNISSQAAILQLGPEQVIFCGTAGGDLNAIRLDGSVLWTAVVGDEVGNTIAQFPQPDGLPIILCTGLWGNLYAFDATGRPLWVHEFRAKNRGRLIVLDANGDSNQEILLNTYGQHVYLFDHQGLLLDDLRLSGCLSTSPIQLDDSEVLTVDASLLAHRIRMGAPKSPYGETPAPAEIQAQWPEAVLARETRALTISNPHGALLCVNLLSPDNNGTTHIKGSITARSRFELPLDGTPEGAKCQCLLHDAQGQVIVQTDWTVPAQQQPAPDPARGPIRAWSTPAYGLFDEQRLAPCSQETALGALETVAFSSLYLDEVDHAGFVVASALEGPCRIHLNLSPLKDAEGRVFTGSVSLYEVAAVGTVNGEPVADALINLGDARLTMIPGGRSAKFWLAADAHNATPGLYAGKLTVEPLFRETPIVELSVSLNILPLRISDPLPLRVCTWDYLPNNWFPEQTDTIFQDMRQHGVNIFPRTTAIPQGAVDTSGSLSMDWTKLDADLAHFGKSDFLLFQLTEPPITFATQPSPEKKHETQLQFMREWRDYLKGRGWDQDRYAFYPVDEPGLGYGGNNVQMFIDAATFFREADPKFRIYTDPVPGLSWTDYQRIAPLVDVWCPCQRLMTGGIAGDPRTKDLLASGKLLFSYECVSQVRSLSPLRYNRSNPWRADFFGLDGIGYWTFSTTDVNHWFPGKSINDEYALVYPGPQPVPSVRWEAVRDGLEDIAAVRLLRAAAAEPGADTAMKQRAEEVLRIAHTDAMELSDEAFIESRDFLKAGDRQVAHTWTDSVLFANHRRQIAELTMALSKQP